MKKQATYGDYVIIIAANNSVSVSYLGGCCDNAKAALREISAQAGFAYEKSWTTQQFGSKLVDFLNAYSAQASASKSEPNKSQKQHVRVEVEIAEHDYLAFDSDEEMVGDSYAFNGDSGPDEIRIYVDGNEIEFDVDELLGRSEYSDYEPLDLEKEWDNEDIVQFGYDDNYLIAVWEFEVDNFDINKLKFCYKCFDAIFGPADYDCEEHRITLRYDGKDVEENGADWDCSVGSFEEQWSRYDEDDCDSDFAEDEEEEEDVETRLNNKYDEVFNDGDIYTVKANGKWGFADKDGEELIAPRYDWMGDEFVEGVIVVGADDRGLGYVNDEGVEIVAPKYEQACVFCNGFAAVGQDDKWGFIDKSGKEVIEVKYDDVDNFENGKAKVTLGDEEFEIDTRGNRIDSDDSEEDVTTLLSNVFGTLAWVMADMDDEVTDEEIQAILGIANGFEIFDLDEVRQRLMFEKMGIRDYNSHKALAASVPEEFRQMMFQALTMVAVSDFQLKQSELDLLAGLSDIWEMDEETTNFIVNDIVERFSTLHPERTMEVE